MVLVTITVDYGLSATAQGDEFALVGENKTPLTPMISPRVREAKEREEEGNGLNVNVRQPDPPI